MRLIYNDALNKRIAPYLERLTKKRTSLDKETMTLLDVFMQYFNMDTRYGTYSDKLEPCIIHIIQEEKIKSVANLFRRKVEQSAPLSIGRRICQPVPHLSEAQKHGVRTLMDIRAGHSGRRIPFCISVTS